MNNNDLSYMEDFYRIRKDLSLKYVNMPLDDMKAELKKSVNKCQPIINKIRNEKSVHKYG